MEYIQREFVSWKPHIKPKYDHTGPFICGRALVESNYKVFFIGPSGKIKVSTNRKREFDSRFQEDLLLYTTSRGDGFLDRSGKVAIPATFYSADRFNSNRAVVMNEDEKCGVINRSGDLKVDYLYDSISKYSFGLAAFKSGDYGYIDRNGSICIEPTLLYAGDFSCGLAKVLKPGRKHKCFINLAGDEIFNTIKFEKVDDFSDGYASVKRQEKYGYIDSFGDVVVPPIYTNVGQFKQGLAAVQNDDGLYGYINSHGKLIIPHKFQAAGRFYEGVARVKYQHGWGMVNRSGKFVVAPQFINISRVYFDLVAYCIYGGCGYIKLI